MTRILIIGGGGMVGQKLAHRLDAEGLAGHSDLDVALFDMGFPPNSARGRQITGNIASPTAATRLATERFDIIFHLAAIVSGEAETDFDKGWSVNMMSMWHLLEALRSEHRASDGVYVPRMVFTSSIAVFGGPFPDRLTTHS